MKFDVAIIGAGPAGLTAGIFTTRAGLKTVCFERLVVGGQASLSSNIENFPGYTNIVGFELMEKFLNHATSCGLELKYENVVSVTQTQTGFSIKTKKENYTAKKIIIACGCKARKLGITNEDKFIGKGVSYCASCDGNFFKNKVVAVVGGGNSAMENVNYLCGICKKVYIINRSEHFRADKHEFEKAKKHKNLEILTNCTVAELVGDKQLESIKVNKNGEIMNLDAKGLFVAIGHEPELSFLNVEVEKDKFGYLVVDENQQTNVKNLFACGDTTSKKFKQVITACADGAIAGNSCIGG